MAQTILSPEIIYGDLFKDIQLSKIFDDSKTFVDCIPRKDPKDILADYHKLKNNPSVRFSLKLFVEKNFFIPEKPASDYETNETDVAIHINNLWTVLRRKSDSVTKGSSLLGLPHEYIVPGGRFREIYYWDSYFTMLGLKESKEYDLMENLVKNFAFLIDTYGHMPNGNRTYYLTRSQPPVFSLMIDLLAEIKGKIVYLTYLPEVEKEYNYWMDKSGKTEHVVIMPDKSILNRYYDQLSEPRPESYSEDIHTGLTLEPDQRPRFYKNIRSAAESGWDFSSRWLNDANKLNSIQTTDLVPVDLNSLLYHIEVTLGRSFLQKGNKSQSKHFSDAALKRKTAIHKYCWSAKNNWYVDYNIALHKPSSELTLAGMFPFFLQTAEINESLLARQVLEKAFLQSGGVVTTLKRSGEQWDSPNGWAPLQWITIIGLENYGEKNLAKEIAMRWIALNKRIFRTTGKLEEKYDVVDADKQGSGGEYPSQDGFGWTNGVLLALINKYNYQA
ncbi:MAG TPA: alpha,alpha-trehalase TreF [Flavisolibacter sp.]|nr:alpha,alpha-trehalase TreF [Flavisolibacter sp.]